MQIVQISSQLGIGANNNDFHLFTQGTRYTKVEFYSIILTRTPPSKVLNNRSIFISNYYILRDLLTISIGLEF